MERDSTRRSQVQITGKRRCLDQSSIKAAASRGGNRPKDGEGESITGDKAARLPKPAGKKPGERRISVNRWGTMAVATVATLGLLAPAATRADVPDGTKYTFQVVTTTQEYGG